MNKIIKICVYSGAWIMYKHILLLLFVFSSLSYSNDVFINIKTACIDDEQYLESAFEYGRPLDPYGKVEFVFSRSTYALGFDADNRIPLWTIYRINKNSILDSTTSLRKKHPSFISDLCLPTQFRIKSSYYNGSGYDRGHMAPFNNIVKDSYTAQISNILTNIAPQSIGLNRGIWKKLEIYEKELVQKSIVNELFVISGPIYNETKKDYIYNGQILVPTAYYKILYNPSNNTTLSFIFANKNKYTDKEKELSNHLTSIDEIEKLTNFDFFYKLEELEVLVENFVARKLWSLQ